MADLLRLLIVPPLAAVPDDMPTEYAKFRLDRVGWNAVSDENVSQVFLVDLKTLLRMVSIFEATTIYFIDRVQTSY